MGVNSLNRILNSRQFALAVTAFLIIIHIALIPASTENRLVINQGLLVNYPGEWIGNGWVSLAVNIALLAATVLTMVLINRHFKIVRANTWLFVWMFFLMELPMQGLFGTFSSASLLALAVVSMTVMLFYTYGARNGQFFVFNVFALLGLVTVWVSVAAFFVPLFVIGMGQMRVLGLKQALAALMGLVTPVWIAWGFGLCEPWVIDLPGSYGTLAEGLSRFTPAQLAYAAVALVIALAVLVASSVKSMNYNASRRAFNGFIELLIAGIVIMILVDSANFPVYLTVLNCLAAFETAHLYTTQKKEAGNLTVLTVSLMFIGMCVWNYL